MSAGDAFREINLNDIKMMVILATGLLIIALIQKIKPTFSITYYVNSKPSYVKAKFISKLLTAGTWYIGGLYVYYFTNLARPSMFSAYVLYFPIILYHLFKWGLTKIIEFRKKNEEERSV